MSEEKEIKTENVKPEEKKQEFLFSEAEYKKFENRRFLLFVDYISLSK